MIVLYALIGLVVGGVINVLADVYPYPHKRVGGPTCPACDQPRPATQSLAIVAYVTSKRTCPKCGRPIAARNVLVEASMAILFAMLYAYYADSVRLIIAGFYPSVLVLDFPAVTRLILNPLIIASFYTSVLVLVTVTDLEHRLIPNRAILPAILIAALLSPLWFGPGWYLALVGGAIGYGFFWLIAVLGEKFIGRGAMGEGDVKLAAFVGLITGFPGIITALVVTIVAGGVISLVLLLTRVVNLRSGIPYGPFIVLGGFITMLYGQQLMEKFFFGA